MDSAPETLTASQDVELENWFSYHSPTPDQLPLYTELRAAAKNFAYSVKACVPPCADRSAALRKIREAVMTANAAIACGGK